jgi:hypothetical protein
MKGDEDVEHKAWPCFVKEDPEEKAQAGVLLEA